jgi:hypothetical protein
MRNFEGISDELTKSVQNLYFNSKLPAEIE